MKTAQKPIVYVCAEFGVSNNLPFYAGGLGILAGDIVKEASDHNLPFIGVGLLYRGKMFHQSIDGSGWQTEHDHQLDQQNLPYEPLLIDGIHLSFVINFLGSDVWVQVFKIQLSEHTVLFLLSTEDDRNSEIWRETLCATYCCDNINQLRQMFLLGVGSARLIKILGVKPLVYHFNEGRPIFSAWELIANENINPNSPFANVRTQIVYTNHTLEGAGNPLFDLQQIREYAKYFVNNTGLAVDDLVRPGVTDNNTFSITQFALNVSKKASSVSKIHFDYCKKAWEGYSWVNITNGVHMNTWQKPEFRSGNLSSGDIWSSHIKYKHELRDLVEARTGYSYDPNRLVISWARRIAGYKRLPSLFDDIKRLKEILSNNEKPVQLLVAGKGHYGDTEGKKTIKEAIRFMQNELSGHALFVPDYDIELAQRMVSGSDVWINVPVPGHEASGTSGMKALSNGVLQMSVSDGWVSEVQNWESMGWILDGDNTPDSFYSTLDQKIVPEYYAQLNGASDDWAKKMQTSIEKSKYFSTKRVLEEYKKLLYK